MARYFDVHPQDPQPHRIAQVVAMLRDDALIAYPTDSSYALGCRLDNLTGGDRIRALRSLDDEEPMTDGWQIKEDLDLLIDAVVDAGECRKELTTVVDWSEGYPEVVRVGMGDPARFQ